MSLPATFDDVFVRACAAKSAAPASDLAIAQAYSLGGTLVSCGGNSDAISFSGEGVSFRDMNGNDVTYTWHDLDFILPSDLSLASDKLNSFSDLDIIAGRFARTAGKVCAALAVALLAYLILNFLYAAISSFIGSFDSVLGTFGEFIAVFLLLLIGSALAPLWLPIVIGLAASGGLFAALGNAIGKAMRPLVRWGLAWRVGKFPNGLVVINSRWVKPPWGTPTTQLVDFIMIGIKLRRRGLA